jgi:hypothetical protein
MVTVDRRHLAMAAAGLAVLLTGCASGTGPSSGGGATPPGAGAPGAGSNTAAATASFDGTWSGTWSRTSAPPTTGTMTFVLRQDGQAISGTIDVAGSACLTKGSVTGHADGARVFLHAVTPAVNGAGQASGTYHGVRSGGKLAGSLVVTCSLGAGIGKWSLQLQQ